MDTLAKLDRVVDGVAYYVQEIAIPLRDGFGKSVDDPGWVPPAEMEIVDVRVEAAYRKGLADCHASRKRSGLPPLGSGNIPHDSWIAKQRRYYGDHESTYPPPRPKRRRK